MNSVIRPYPVSSAPTGKAGAEPTEPMNYTEEQAADFQARAQAFQDEFTPLYEEMKKKHECEFVYGVVTVPGPQGIHGLGVQQSLGDLKYKSVPSPEEFLPKS